MESIELANKMFEKGGVKSKFNTVLSDLYEGVTDLNIENNARTPGRKTPGKPLVQKPRSRVSFFG